MNQVHHYFHTLNKLNSLLNFLLSYVFIKNVKNDSRHNNRPIITSVCITLAKVLRGGIDRFGFDKLLNRPAHFKSTYYIIQMVRCVITGYADVGWNNPEVYTPTLDKMAAKGRLLTQSYMQPVCTA